MNNANGQSGWGWGPNRHETAVYPIMLAPG
jgi:hypothetical protein